MFGVYQLASVSGSSEAWTAMAVENTGVVLVMVVVVVSL